MNNFVDSGIRVEKLNLSDCKLISDIGIKNLSLGCEILSSLNLSGCELLTTGGITRMLVAMKNLKQLWLQGCKNLDFDVLDKIEESQPFVINY